MDIKIVNGNGINGNGSKQLLLRGTGMDNIAIMEPDMNNHNHKDHTKAYMAEILNRFTQKMAKTKHYHMGYPNNLDFDYGALAPLLMSFFLNNVGDPFIHEGGYGLHSREFEVAVLDWFANLWEIEKDEYWGYVTSGGTEGNLHGILIGRDVLPDGILYTSKESHYSIFKAARMYKLDCIQIDTSLITGEIDYLDFKAKLLLNKDKPAIINLNIGTTMKGAVDNIDIVIQTLEECGFSKDRFYIHCDGALFGIMMPFVEHAVKVSFKKAIGSVTISGHKFVGCPVPCGVYITRMQHINTMAATNIEYMGSRDNTIIGSRSGLGPIFLWYTLNIKGCKGFQKDVQMCLKNALYLRDRLAKVGISVMLNEVSTTVVFEKPLDSDFVNRWQLACKENMAHVIVMPNVTIERLDEFLDELLQKRSEWYKHKDKEGGVEPPCLAHDIGANNCLCVLHK